MKKIKQKFKLFSLGLVVVIVLAIVFFVVNNLLPKSEVKNDDGEASLLKIQKQYEEISKNLFTVSGEFVCLPVKDDDVPHNDLCISGIKSKSGDYYRLQALSDDKNNVVNKVRKGQMIEISGELINEQDDVYKTSGTIKVVGIKFLSTDENNKDE